MLHKLEEGQRHGSGGLLGEEEWVDGVLARLKQDAKKLPKPTKSEMPWLGHKSAYASLAEQARACRLDPVEVYKLAQLNAGECPDATLLTLLATPDPPPPSRASSAASTAAS